MKTKSGDHLTEETKTEEEIFKNREDALKASIDFLKSVGGVEEDDFVYFSDEESDNIKTLEEDREECIDFIKSSIGEN